MVQPSALTAPLDIWRRQIEMRRDVFLGYCSASTATALAIKAHLSGLGVAALDGQTDFQLAGNILAQIGLASD